MEFPADKKIVIVGAGYGGCEVGFDLLKKGANFIIIDTRDAMHNNLGAARAGAIAGFANKTVIPYKPTFGDHFIQASVVDIDTQKRIVSLSNGVEVAYDALVISTGTSGPFPTKHNFSSYQEAIRQYEELVIKVQKAETITVIGGGAAGLEVAGEIITAYPTKKVNLVHGGSALCQYPNVTEAFQQKILDWFKSWKVNVFLKARVVNLKDIVDKKPGVVITDGGENLDSDLILKATGLKVNSAPYKTALADKIGDHGALKVDEYLRVEGYENIYAVGDCNNVPETKLAYGAKLQGKVAVSNICKHFNNSSPLDVYQADGFPFVMVVALGKGIGFGILKDGTNMPDAVAGAAKAEDLYTAQTWSEFNQTPPA